MRNWNRWRSSAAHAGMMSAAPAEARNPNCGSVLSLSAGIGVTNDSNFAMLPPRNYKDSTPLTQEFRKLFGYSCNYGTHGYFRAATGRG